MVDNNDNQTPQEELDPQLQAEPKPKAKRTTKAKAAVVEVTPEPEAQPEGDMEIPIVSCSCGEAHDMEIGEDDGWEDDGSECCCCSEEEDALSISWHAAMGMIDYAVQKLAEEKKASPKFAKDLKQLKKQLNKVADVPELTKKQAKKSKKCFDNAASSMSDFIDKKKISKKRLGKMQKTANASRKKLAKLFK